MGIKNAIKKVGDKAGNKIAKLAALSSGQVEEIQLQREKYLLEKPDPKDELALDTTWRMMAANSIEIYNAYLSQLKDLYLPIEKNAEYGEAFSTEHNIRYLNITKWVQDKKENSLEKLVNVYAVLSNEDCNIALVFNRTQKETRVYLAVINTANSDNNVNTNSYKNRLIEAIRGNFPGAEWSEDGVGIIPCLDNERPYSVAAASNIPTEKSEKFISQTIEKLLDGVIPTDKKKEYTVVLLATPIKDVEQRKLKLGEIYSGMVPYASWQTNFTYTENNAIGSSATVGVNVGASAGIQNGTNNAITDSESNTENESVTGTQSQSDSLSRNEAIAEAESATHTSGTSITDTMTEGKSDSLGGNTSQAFGENTSETVNVGGGLSPVSASGTVGTSAITTMGTGYQHGWNSSTAKALGKTATEALTKGITNTVSNTVAKTTGTAVANTLGKAVTKAMAVTSGVTKGTNLGVNFGANFARSSTVTAMIGKNEGITQTFTNFNIKHALDLLEHQMERLEQSSALGMWDFAAYVLSEEFDVAGNVAHSYLALTLGEESYMSKSVVNVWKGSVEEEKSITKEIADYIRELRHPIFALRQDRTLEDKAFNVYPPIVTATTSLSGKELAYSLNFPQKSVAGLPVLECAEFGRNVVTYDIVDKNLDKLELGNIFHMNHVEENIVELTKKSLASHTFITGSTGAGKSNTVYQIIDKARKKDVKFLVIEPAKGEYKHIFGSDKDVLVYGTNPSLTPLLKINPFSFPAGIHILEHLDRLVELFNVCWPMYAAMPAVLKSAVEKSYQDCGWDLMRSQNKYGEMLYPSFVDVAYNIKEIIDNSEFDTDNKGAYKGSLLTRLESLTNGINGMIFTCDEISNEDLFDKNVIVDLSRVGSSETKSLIMGMLVLKLQEYRMTSNEMNVDFRHLTVLEEAHNLLKRTSTEQSSESANLLGKSVEMLSNAIAEMRTYGEGFIIADQAPGLMDMSVIRNTNTKIIMRLPDQTDRELVGKAANLNEDQIKELAKLPCGVAAIYQNEWVQPVLCKVDRFTANDKRYTFTPDNDVYLDAEVKTVSESLLDCIMDKELFRKSNKRDISLLKSRVIKSKLSKEVKKDFIEYLKSDDENRLETLRLLIFDFLEAEEAIKESRQCNDINEWIHNVVDNLKPSVKQYSSYQIDLAMALILNEQSLRDTSYENILGKFTDIYKIEGGVY